ncbi:universal stress protein [Halalkalibaculum sp. DA3122]|uniref:universal stress protein n=1 Tax=Halalkalibaculum sp. DA3122 TaxID=3373607 RepID=UPI003754C0BC
MEARPKTRFPGSTKHSSNGKSGYTVLVPLQDLDLTKTLLPPAIRTAKRHDGKIILLNIIEIPYQLPPSEAKQFTLEREFKLQYARQIIETAGCDAEIMVRVAHRIPSAIEQLALSLDIDLIIIWAKNKGLLWNKEIYQKLYAVNSNLVVAKELVETHFEDVFIQVDDLQAASSMMEHATYLFGNEEGIIHMISEYSENDEKSTLRKVRSIVDGFHRQNPWFAGKTIIHQLEQKSAAREYLKDIYHKVTGSTGVLVSYPSGKRSRTDSWLAEVAKDLNLPVYILKIARIEPVGIDRIANQVQQWLGFASEQLKA